MAQQLRTPDLDKQRVAMKKLSFLIGRWSGQAHVQRMIEGIGRTVSDNQLVLQAMGIISYDDEAETYRMRAFTSWRARSSCWTMARA